MLRGVELYCVTGQSVRGRREVESRCRAGRLYTGMITWKACHFTGASDDVVSKIRELRYTVRAGSYNDVGESYVSTIDTL